MLTAGVTALAHVSRHELAVSALGDPVGHGASYAAVMDWATIVEDEGAALADAAATDLGAVVPATPGWDVTELLRHIGQIQARTSVIVRTGTMERPSRRNGMLDDPPNEMVLELVPRHAGPAGRRPPRDRRSATAGMVVRPRSSAGRLLEPPDGARDAHPSRRRRTGDAARRRSDRSSARRRWHRRAVHDLRPGARRRPFAGRRQHASTSIPPIPAAMVSGWSASIPM